MTECNIKDDTFYIFSCFFLMFAYVIYHNTLTFYQLYNIYKCKVYKTLKNQKEYKKNKEIALKLYAENKKMFDSYTQHFNSVYYETIKNE